MTVAVLLGGTAFAILPAVLPSDITGGADTALAACSGNGVSGGLGFYEGNGDANVINCSDVVAIKAKGNDDTLNLSGVIGLAEGNNGSDTFNVSSGLMDKLDGGNGDDTFNITGGGILAIYGEDDDDTINLNGGAVGLIDGGDKKDTINLNSGLFGAVLGGNGADTITLSGGSPSDDGFGAYIDGGGNDDTINLNGGFFGVVLGDRGEDTINLAGASSIDGGAYIDAGDDNDTFNWSSGSLFLFNGGGGNDKALVTTSNFSGVPALNGGGGNDDALTFDGIDFSVLNLTLSNWETITVRDGVMNITPLVLSTVNLALSEDDGKGLVIESDAGLVVNNNTLALTGDLSNSGYVDMQDGAADDEVDISDDYVGGGDLLVDANFSTNMADMLDIGGDASGTTEVGVSDVSGPVVTGENVLVASIGGANTAAFVLSPNQMTGGFKGLFAGAFEYDLETIGNDIYLVSSFSPAAPIYDAYGQSLLGLYRTPTMQERMGDRYMDEVGAGPAFWGRVSGSHSEFTPSSITDAAFDQSIWRIEAGVDGILEDGDDGTVVAGFSVEYADGRSDVTSPSGAGDITSRGAVAGISLTALQNDGSYADLQARLGYSDNDLSSDAWGSLANGVNAVGGALSLEIGQKFRMGDGWSITPQTQVSGTVVHMDGFTGPVGEDVSFADAMNVAWRNGLSVDWSGASAGGTATLHGIANLVYTLAGDSTATVSGFDLESSSSDNLSGEIGLGGTHHWGDRFALTGQVLAAKGFGDGADEGYRFSGSVSLSAKW
ncbi:autotransporter outer membrane beta-barrel domain-containing protein [Oricola sp.]|uniref:autotransporter outer membrane beta-barrel domain-containing protein n=1 Tax=Oricola sp. TaxID=1979950 RepID=UPI0025E64C85|nr:autotransporter outer membrane beta-barrel domain-containing protein [Oricola sp.]MCI5076309.1 autotransporter outer membrane beta-barrel domain-containing protein [Oricola sp.]